jgi:DNA-binding beta-propeller fold protein YncE
VVRIRAPEFPSHLPWLNCGSPLSLKSLRGQIVLLDFWTYGCINCLHVIPDLHHLQQKFEHRLAIIGIHTAKFDHERDMAGIQQAILRYGVTHPVLVDSDRILWDHYTIRAYPTFVLIDPQGYIVTMVSGEGQRAILEELIQRLIEAHEGKETLTEQQIGEFLEVRSPLWATATQTSLAFPGKVLVDSDRDTLYIADTGHHRIVVTDLNGTLRTTIGTGTTGGVDGNWNSAQFSAPQGMALDASQQFLFVADAGNHCIRKIDLQQEQVETIAGTGVQGRLLFPHCGKAKDIALNSPWDLALLGDKLYIAMAGSHQIWVLDLFTQTIQTLLGTGAEFCVDGLLDSAAFAQPYGISTNGERLFVADSETSTIRVITLGDASEGFNTGAWRVPFSGDRPFVHTLCGQGQLHQFGDRDGFGTAVQLQHCSGVACDREHVWIADTYNHKIKRVNPVTGECQTVAGGAIGFRDGRGTETRFSEPSGLAWSRSSNQLYIADTNNHAIRRIDLTSLEVTTLSIPGLCAPTGCAHNAPGGGCTGALVGAEGAIASG